MEPLTEIRPRSFKGSLCMKASLDLQDTHSGLSYELKMFQITMVLLIFVAMISSSNNSTQETASFYFLQTRQFLT